MKQYEEPSMIVVKLMNNDIVATDMIISETVPSIGGGGDGNCDFENPTPECIAADGAR
ncbi:hypothetical protein [Bifidobacterium sp. UTBIF-78]|uniref:hypothetical protein n=1 Tax=Bifidobacterium sp. UTBIF-78 TaxID=1465263 RepID=UPI0015E2AE10|nr:hypothetical protein [Bifidobacterium sp. UTBIF-78]